MDRGAWRATFHGIARVGYDLATKPQPPPPPALQADSLPAELPWKPNILLTFSKYVDFPKFA